MGWIRRTSFLRVRGVVYGGLWSAYHIRNRIAGLGSYRFWQGIFSPHVTESIPIYGRVKPLVETEPKASTRILQSVFELTLTPPIYQPTCFNPSDSLGERDPQIWRQLGCQRSTVWHIVIVPIKRLHSYVQIFEQRKSNHLKWWEDYLPWVLRHDFCWQ